MIPASHSTLDSKVIDLMGKESTSSSSLICLSPTEQKLLMTLRKATSHWGHEQVLSQWTTINPNQPSFIYWTRALGNSCCEENVTDVSQVFDICACFIRPLHNIFFLLFSLVQHNTPDTWIPPSIPTFVILKPLKSSAMGSNR